MGVKKVFEYLGIPMEKDEKKIHDAYHRLLLKANPEDDPEGFKRLREAYEKAIAYARMPGQEDTKKIEWSENYQIGKFLRHLMDVYESLPRRLDVAEWKTILEDPILQSFDDGETAVWAMFSYFVEHFRLPCKIWRMIDNMFFIEENQKEFKEHLPEGFVEHMLYKIQDEGELSDFPYEKFQGEPQADYDEFIRIMYELLNEPNDHTSDGMKQTEKALKQLEALGISHPWYDLEKAKYLLKTGKSKKALQIANRLLAQHGDDERISLGSAMILQTCGFPDIASDIYWTYLNREEKQTVYGIYTALYHLAVIAAEYENWEQARELAIDANILQNTEEIYELIHRINHELIEQYLKKEEELTKDEILLLGKCFYDNRRAEEGIALLEAHMETYEDTAEYHKLMCCLYWSAGKADELLLETKRWRKSIKKLVPEDSEREKELQYDEALSWFYESGAFKILYDLQQENDIQGLESQELLDEALDCCTRAIELEPNYTEFRMSLVLIYREKEEYEKIIDQCEKILELNGQHFWACVYQQEAYENLGMAQEVIETFYRARNIDDGYAQIYLRALDVFMAFHQYEDAHEIFELAEEAGIADNHELTVRRMEFFWHLELDGAEWKKAASFSEKAIKRLEKEGAPPKLLAEAYLNLSKIYEEYDGDYFYRWLKKAEKCALRSIEMQDSSDARYFLGRINFEYQKNFRKAYEHLKESEAQGFEFEWLYYYIARCHEIFREWDEAIEYYRQTLDFEPEFEDALWRISYLYRKKFERTEQGEYARLALYYIDLQDEKYGESRFAHRQRAQIYLHMGEYDRALEAINKEIAEENDSSAWFLKGDILRYQEKYDEAITCYEKSIEAEDRYGEDGKTCWRNIFRSYSRERRYDEGIEYFEKTLQKGLTAENVQLVLGNLCELEASAGRYEKALYWLEELYGSVKLDKRYCGSWKEEACRITEVMNIWQEFHAAATDELEDKMKQSAALAEEAIKDDGSLLKERAQVCHHVGDLFYYSGKCTQAVYFYENAYKLAKRAKKYDYLSNLLLNLMRNHYWLGNKKKAKKYGVEYRKTLEKPYAECEDLNLSMETLMTRPKFVNRKRLYQLSCWAYYTEQYDKAKEYLDLMSSRNMCYFCDKKGCTELWELKGLIAYNYGDMEKALKYFDRAVESNWHGGNKDAYFMIRKIKEERP